MAMNEKVSEVLEKQINEELFSSYFYLTIADYFEDRGLKGFANWYVIQMKEELDHAMALRRYLLDNDYTPTMEAIEKPTANFASDLDALKAGLAHEEHVTDLIHNCYSVAHSVHDIRAMKMLDWFVEEQGEEEANARDMITNMELFGTDPKGLYELDREYQARVYTQLTALPL
ncbi:ferritin [Collinsella vaginalis]|uniref:ferritin n=1 Tax=Collinsella vaginalis TaxID=1870987 RepID=UPI000A26951C|nr:ferritin [Collinsella vaginalis]